MKKAEALSGTELAKARDEFLESEEGRRLCKGTASGQFLQNRLVKAFFAGVKAAEAGKKALAAQGAK